MKTSILFYIIITLLFFSCKKKENVQECANNPVQKEGFNPAFTEFVHSMKFTIKGMYFGGGITAKIERLHQFKFEEGVFVNEKYFYVLKKKKRYVQSCETTATDWTDAGFYRYDFENKKSYYYNNPYENNPKLLFDFSNKNIGDTIDLEESMQVKMVIYEILTETLNGLDYPIIKGKIINYYHIGGSAPDYPVSVPGQLYVSPFAPNPVYFDKNHTAYGLENFTLQDFCAFSPPIQGFRHKVELKADHQGFGNYSTQVITTSP